jgi:predicted  nucleic acid-binding Zn-ribbon protein
VLANLIQKNEQPQEDERLLKLYWNRAAVKRELAQLRRERHDLMDRLKDQEGAINRAQEQLDGLERLLTNPLAAANAMVYFQLRHLWRVASQRLSDFGAELRKQRAQKELAQLQHSEMSKRQRRLSAIAEKSASVVEKYKAVTAQIAELESKLENLNAVMRLFKGRSLSRTIQNLVAARTALKEKLAELKDLHDKISNEPMPEPPGLSVESRRMINTAIIALAQHLVIHFSEHDLASLSKASMDKAVGDMKFGDRRDCDRLVERIRERIGYLKSEKQLPALVQRRAAALSAEIRFRNEADTVPLVETVATITVEVGGAAQGRRSSDAPLRINVLAEEYWDLYSALV